MKQYFKIMSKLASLCRWFLFIKLVASSSEQSPVSLLGDDRGFDLERFGLSTRHSYYADDFDVEAVADENPWSEWVQELMQTNDIRSSIQKALDAPRWWLAWEHLHPSTRDKVIEDVMPLLLGGRGTEWRLHCSDAYRLCQIDKNCYSKFWNFVSSCSSGNGGGQMARRMFNMAFGSANPRRRIARSPRARKPPSWKRERSRKRNKLWARIRRKRPVKKFRPRKIASKYLHYWMGQRWKKVFYKRLAAHDEEMCPPKCVEALILLNNTIYSSLLARCDCGLESLLRQQANSSARHSADGDNFNQPHTRQHLYGTESSAPVPTWNEGFCRRHQKKARECRPRLFKARGGQVGCTESRVRCEHNPRCRKAQMKFLRSCSQVINGLQCTRACVGAIVTLKRVSRHFSTCVCDGVEGRNCRTIRSNIFELCGCRSTPSQRFRGTWPTRKPARTRIWCPGGRRSEKRVTTVENVSNDSHHRRHALRYLSTMLFTLFALKSLKF